MLSVDNFRQRLREVDEKNASGSSRRRVEMSGLREEFIVSWIVERLIQRDEGRSTSADALRAEANNIRWKSGFRTLYEDDMSVRRTIQEERLLVSAKVAWHKLLKAEGIASARPWSRERPKSIATGAHPAPLDTDAASPLESGTPLHDYIAEQARHLQEVCARAKDEDPRSISEELEEAIRRLTLLAAKPA
jgi:hypothetical protein